MSIKPLIVVDGLAKSFTLHNAGEARIPVFDNLHLEVKPGECVVLAGESGVGKSTLMRSIYGNYLPTHGSVRVLHDGAETLLGALRPPQAHGHLPPATVSGGEQQRVNIARSFIRNYPVLLLDEPTASLDAENRAIVVNLIRQALSDGAAMIGIFHDHDVRDAVATSLFNVTDFKAAA